MGVIHANFENGVFKPTEPVALPEHSRGEVHIPSPATSERELANASLFDILSRTYDTGQTAAAARHNEHQQVPNYLPCAFLFSVSRIRAFKSSATIQSSVLDRSLTNSLS